MSRLDALFQPLTLKSLRLANRIVMAPMTRYHSPGGVPTDEVARYYERRAAGGTGLLISEGVGINRAGAVYDTDIPHLHGTGALQGWRRVVESVHRAGGRMAPQLWHVGAMIDPGRVCPWPDRLESPSGRGAPGHDIGGVMTENDIADTIAAFAAAAADAKHCGFDCVEIHGAHGYLVDQFFWSPANERPDRFGGATLRERARFAAEVVRAVRTAVGQQFVISLRISQFKQLDFGARLAATPDELAQWLTPLAEAGVDMFHCSQRRYWEPEFAGETLNFAGWAKKVTGKHTITVGSVGLDNDLTATVSGDRSGVRPLDNLLERLEREEFDLVAVGRALLSDPSWPIHVRTGDPTALVGFSPQALASLT
jgi:2,4-dienoyl-CoA reductase-like NADH-dependent reductase (Old Yellow Enzyme family)